MKKIINIIKKKISPRKEDDNDSELMRKQVVRFCSLNLL